VTQAVHGTDGTGFYTYAVEAGNAYSGVWIWRFDQHFPNIDARRAKVDMGTFGTGGPYRQGSGQVQVLNVLYDAVLSSDERRMYVAVDDGPEASLRVFESRGLFSTEWPPYRHSSTPFHQSGIDCVFESLDTDCYGPLRVGANCSGPILPISLCLAQRADGDTGSRTMALVKVGTSIYTGQPDPFFPRVNDYATLAIDPLDRRSLYLTGQVGLAQDAHVGNVDHATGLALHTQPAKVFPMKTTLALLLVLPRPPWPTSARASSGRPSCYPRPRRAPLSWPRREGLSLL